MQSWSRSKMPYVITKLQWSEVVVKILVVLVWRHDIRWRNCMRICNNFASKLLVLSSVVHVIAGLLEKIRVMQVVAFHVLPLNWLFPGKMHWIHWKLNFGWKFLPAYLAHISVKLHQDGLGIFSLIVFFDTLFKSIENCGLLQFNFWLFSGSKYCTRPNR